MFPDKDYCVAAFNAYTYKNHDGVVQEIDSLRNLTQLQIKLVKLIEGKNSSDQECVVVFDSLDVFSLYHDDQIILKFVYSMTKLLHKHSVSGFFLSSKNPFLPKLVQFFDDFVELKKF